MPRDYNKPRRTNDGPINRARKAKGYTQKELAEALGVGYVTMQNWEYGRYPVPYAKLLKMAEILDVNVQDLVEDGHEAAVKYHIANFRRAKKMTQGQLADAIGRSQVQVAFYEAEKYNPPADVLNKIASTLGVTVEELRKGPEESQIGHNISKTRKAKGMTQLQLAEKLGVLQYMVSRYENGVSIPSDSVLAEIADALDTTVDALKARPEVNTGD